LGAVHYWRRFIENFSFIAAPLHENASLSHDSYVEQYVVDEDFKEVFENLTHGA
jgi:hypothetical protein